MASLGLTKGFLAFLNYATQLMFMSTKVLPVMVMVAFIPWLRRKCPGHEHFLTILLVLGLILFTVADSQISPNFSVIGVFMDCCALIMDFILFNLHEAIFTMNTEITQMEMLFCSTTVGLLLLITLMILTGKLIKAWNSCCEVFEAITTFIRGGGEGEMKRKEEQKRTLFGISLSQKPKWQQFFLCSIGFFIGYLVNGVCEEYVYNHQGFSFGWYFAFFQGFVYLALIRLYGFTMDHVVNSWSSYVKLSAILMASHGLTKGSLAFLNCAAQLMFKFTKVLPVMVMVAFFPWLSRKFLGREHFLTILLVLGLILFTVADSHASPNFSVIGVFMDCGALIMDFILFNLHSAIFTMNTETTQMEMLFCSTTVGLLLLIILMILTGKLIKVWNSCYEVFEAITTFIGGDGGEGEMKREEEQKRTLSGISLSEKPKWQQFFLCSIGFFIGYLVNGACEEYVYNRQGFSFGWYFTFVQGFVYLALIRLYGLNMDHVVNPWSSYVKLSAILMGSHGLTKGSLAFLNCAAQLMSKFTKVLSVIVMVAFIPWLRRKCPGHEHFLAISLVLGLILFTVADSQTSPNFSVIGVFIDCGALIVDFILGNLQEAIFAMNPEPTQMEMLFCSTTIGLLLLITLMTLTGKLIKAWNSCYEVFEAIATFVGLVSVLSLIAIVGWKRSVEDENKIAMVHKKDFKGKDIMKLSSFNNGGEGVLVINSCSPEWPSPIVSICSGESSSGRSSIRCSSFSLGSKFLILSSVGARARDNNMDLAMKMEKQECCFHSLEDEPEKEQSTPMFVMDAPYDQDEEEEEESTPHDFQPSLANIERSKHQLLQKIQRFECIAGLEQSDLDPLFEAKQDANENDNEIIMKATELVKQLKDISSTTINDYNEQILLYIFIEGMLSMSDDAISNNDQYARKEQQLLEEAINWLNRDEHSVGEYDRVACLKEMEKNGQWRSFKDDETGVAMDLELDIMESLLDELVLDLIA